MKKYTRADSSVNSIEIIHSKTIMPFTTGVTDIVDWLHYRISLHFMESYRDQYWNWNMQLFISSSQDILLFGITGIFRKKNTQKNPQKLKKKQNGLIQLDWEWTCAEFILGNMKQYLHFPLCQCWSDMGSWNPSSQISSNCLCYTINIMDVHALVTEGPRESDATALTMFA